MYSPFEGGSIEDICGLKINVPPVGYVPDHWGGTGELMKVPILFKSENKWTRIVPEHINEELERIHLNPKDEPDMDVDGLQDFVETEWQRRYNGVWFYNNGKPTYITGLHYFYLMWWQMDTGYPNFREFDRKSWYFWQYCCEDPDCVGMIEISKRKIGKTYKGAVSVFEYISRFQRKKGGIVSKTSDDARDTAYTECLVFPFTNLPFFFKPVVDPQSGTLFKGGMKFVATSRKAKGKFQESLASSISFSDADINGYNGPKLARYLADEAAKVVICDVYQRHNIARECCMTDGKIIGKMYYTTTIEDLERGGKNFLKLVKDSNQNKRLPSGHTSTRLYTFFLPVSHAYNFDEYGFPQIEKNRKEIMENIQGLEGNPTAQSAYRRMNALSMSDLFSAESDGCPFHIGNLTMAEQDIENSPSPPYVVGNFIETGGQIEFMENPNGRWHFSTLKFQQYANKKGYPHSVILPPDVTYEDCKMFPANTHQFGIGVDPVDSGDWAKYGKSCFAVSIYYNYDPSNEEESDDYIGDYIHDPSNPEDSYKDLMMCCRFFSAPAFIETNKATDLMSYFKRNGMSAFIMNKPAILSAKLQNNFDPGASASDKMINLYINRLQAYTTLRVWRREENKGCKLPRTIKQLKEFTRDTRGEKDLAVAAGYSKVAAEANMGEEQVEGSNYYIDRLLGAYGVDK